MAQKFLVENLLRIALLVLGKSFSIQCCNQGCKSLLSIGGDNLQFYPNFALFSTLGDEPRPRFFSGEPIKLRAKKRSSAKMEHFFSPNSGEDQKKVFTKNGTRRVARNSQLGLIFGSGGGDPSAQKFCIFLQK